MSIETRIFDPATYLDSDEARAAYMTEALDTGDPAFIADALAVIARAQGLAGVAPEVGLSGEARQHTFNPDGSFALANLLRVIHALGLRLTVTPTAH